MGRWAQRQRGGGGINQPIAILSATIADSTHAHAQFSRAVVAAEFNGFFFQSDPSSEVGQSVSQISAQVLEIEFAGDITSDTDLIYSGSVANVITPQTVNYS
jgi:hypothetical protein